MQANDRLLRIKQVQEYVPVCRSKIYQMMKEKTFPQPLKIGKTNVWKESEIVKYVEKLR